MSFRLMVGFVACFACIWLSIVFWLLIRYLLLVVCVSALWFGLTRMMVLAISFVFVSLWLWVVVGLVCCLCLGW